MGVSKHDFDFSGYATRNDLRCSDGRTIRSDAFVDNDGSTKIGRASCRERV